MVQWPHQSKGSQIQMRSNQHTLPLWTHFVVYHDSANHHVTIDIDNQIIYNKTFSPGIEHHVKIDDVFDFQRSDHKKIKIVWQGDLETENKFFMIDKWVINNQHLSAFKCIYVPDENDYIRNIKKNGTTEEKQTLRKQITFTGNKFGWFGKIIWHFVLGNTLEVNKTLLANKPEQLVHVQTSKINIDKEEAILFDRIKKKN